MEILLTNIGRRFNQEWIFKDLTYSFVQGQAYAVLGPNGSGKSTLLQVVAGSLAPSKGNLKYRQNEKEIPVENIYQHLSLATPYLELIEEFTLQECLDFHYRFKGLFPGIEKKEILPLLELEKAANKEIRYFSSGMKQRVKLLFALCSDSPIVLLDEPTTNLDQAGIQWYFNMIKRFTSDKVLLVCSNQPHEYEFCKHQLHIVDFK